MQIDKNSIGKKLYIIETNPDSKSTIIHYGELMSVLPKYMFLDKFSSEYKREQSFLFKCKTYKEDKNFDIILISDSNHIFESFDSICDCFKNTHTLFGPSVIIKERENKNES